MSRIVVNNDMVCFHIPYCFDMSRAVRHYFTHSLALHASLPFTLLIVFTSSMAVVIPVLFAMRLLLLYRKIINLPLPWQHSLYRCYKT